MTATMYTEEWRGQVRRHQAKERAAREARQAQLNLAAGEARSRLNYAEGELDDARERFGEAAVAMLLDGAGDAEELELQRAEEALDRAERDVRRLEAALRQIRRERPSGPGSFGP